MITAITATGDRPLAFKLCQLWMMKQKVRPDQWLVVDDGKVPVVPVAPMQYIRRERGPGDPVYTISVNIRTALPHARGDLIFIVEDDDYYARDYIEVLSARLAEYSMVGLGRARYYHVPMAFYFQHPNTAHASLGETAFRRDVIPEFERALAKEDRFIDMVFWPTVNRPKLVFYDTDDHTLHCSLKAMPGRRGASHGHDPRARYWSRYGQGRDFSREILRKWADPIYTGVVDRTLSERAVDELIKREIDRVQD